MKLTLGNFTGIAPRFSPKLLPANGAQTAENVRLESGEIRAVGTPAALTAPVVAAARSVYALGAPNFKYLTWATDVDVARSPLADVENRIYYTGDGKPKKTFLTLATAGPGPYPGTGWLYLGVPTPTTAPTAASSGAGSITEQRVYVYTHVTQFGSVLEESKASPAVQVNLVSASGATVSGIADPLPADLTNRNYAFKRLYRSVGAGQLILTADNIPLGTTTFTDNLTTVPGDLLPSLDWGPPPDDLKGITLLPGNILVGFRNNEIWFSEPEFPHAWPPKYMQTVNAPVVAIRAFGNNLAVATQARAEIGSGLHPDSFTFAVLPLLAPCVSKRSMAGDEFGVAYATDSGVVSVGADGANLVTRPVFTRYEFAGFNPTTITAVSFDRKYFAFYERDGLTRAFVFQGGDNPPLSTLSVAAAACTVEQSTNRLVVVDAVTNQLMYVDPVDTTPMTYTWRSRVNELPFPGNFACGKITASSNIARLAAAAAAENAAIVARNAAAYATLRLGSTVNASLMNARRVNGSVLEPLVPAPTAEIGVKVFAGGRLIYAQAVAPLSVFRLPGGFRERDWEVEVTGQQEIQRIELATSVTELAS